MLVLEFMGQVYNLVFSQGVVEVNEHYSRYHFNSCYSSISECFGFNYSCKEIKDLNLHTHNIFIQKSDLIKKIFISEQLIT